MSATLVRLALMFALVISANSAFAATPAAPTATPAPASPAATPTPAAPVAAPSKPVNLPVPAPKAAATQGCKGLTQTDCSADQNCVWAPAGTNQAGKQVPAHCKNLACKGLDQSACLANSACFWTDARTRKDGKEIAAACRRAKGTQEQPSEVKAAKASAPTSDKAPSSSQAPAPGAHPSSPSQGAVKE